MKLWIEKPRRNLPAKLAVSNLKLCPLCDSLNARSNHICFVCGWHGAFITDSRSLHTSLVLLLEQCPELAEGVNLPGRHPWPVRWFAQVGESLKSAYQTVAARLQMRRRGRNLDLWI